MHMLPTFVSSLLAIVLDVTHWLLRWAVAACLCSQHLAASGTCFERRTVQALLLNAPTACAVTSLVCTNKQLQRICSGAHHTAVGASVSIS